MANWNNPTVNSNYVTFVDEVKNRDVDSARMFDGTGDNLPNLTIRWNQSNNRFERWSGTVWEGRTIGITGGGTGATTAAGARSNLNLGSMATQNSNAVGVTGGSITGVSFSGTGTLSGNASTASTWQTARTLTIGATGKSVNGSANVTWTAGEIGFNNANNLTTGVVDNTLVGIYQEINNPGGLSGVIYLSRVGKSVTVSWTPFNLTSAASSISFNSIIPPAFRPITYAESVTRYDLSSLLMSVITVSITTQGNFNLVSRDSSGTRNVKNFSGGSFGYVGA